MMSRLDVIRSIEDVTKLEHSEEQLSVLNHTGGMVILACAGSGKTTILTEVLAVRILSGEIDPSKLLCTTYSKTGSVEMEQRFKILMTKLGHSYQISVKTMHASYYKVLRQFGINKGVCKDGQRKQFIREACRENKVFLEDEDTDLLDSILSYQINKLQTDKEICGSSKFKFDDIDETKYRLIRQGFNAKKEEAGLLDFEDMQLYMYTMTMDGSPIQNDVINYCRSMWEYFFVDEFQDTSMIQFKILQKLVPDASKLMVIGDDDQCIYDWRGSDPNILLNIQGLYDIRKFILPINYRCREEILKFADTGIRNLMNRQPKDMKSFKTGGEVRFMDVNSSNLYEMSLDAFKYIKGEIADGTRLSSISVICRNNIHSSILSNMLLQDGIYTKCMENMKISKCSIYKDIKSIIALMDDTYNYTLASGILWKLVPYLGVKGSRLISDFMKNTGVSFKVAMQYVLCKFGGVQLADTAISHIKISDKLLDRFSYIAGGFKYQVWESLRYVYEIVNSTVDTNEKKFSTLLFCYNESVSFLYKREERTRYLNGLLNYYAVMCKSNGFDNMKNFMNLTEQYESGGVGIVGDLLTMTTAHSAKGMEWDNVIVLACDNITFPATEELEEMNAENRHQEIEEYLDSERRLHYVCMTRARNKLTILSAFNNLSLLTCESLGLIGCNEEVLRLALNGKNSSSRVGLYEEVVNTIIERGLNIPNPK